MTDHPRGKAYTDDDITVYYDASRCIHFAACVRGLPEVFDPKAKPWIKADAAPAEQIAEVVRHCPTGALHYELKNGPAETPDPTSIEVRQNGPLFLRGDLTLAAPAGTVTDTRLALCRCGMSSNKPFCDGSHRGGFEALGGAVLNKS